ncbi:MAG: histidine kinase dimerization/phospho-acceptor domain-containing protein [Ignavibacteria bacterium]|jgi:light-regulated signal transduction histidine kinase (bacteriophytochrome)
MMHDRWVLVSPESILKSEEEYTKQENIIRDSRSSVESIGHYLAHELRTPLASIMSYSQMIMTDKELTEEEIREMVGRIEMSSNRLTEAIESILLFFEYHFGGREDTTGSLFATGKFSDSFFCEITKKNYYVNSLNLHIVSVIEEVTLGMHEDYLRILIAEVWKFGAEYFRPSSKVTVGGKKHNDRYFLFIKADKNPSIKQKIKSINDLKQTNSRFNNQRITEILKILNLVKGELKIEDRKLSSIVIKIILPVAGNK